MIKSAKECSLKCIHFHSVYKIIMVRLQKFAGGEVTNEHTGSLSRDEKENQII